MTPKLVLVSFLALSGSTYAAVAPNPSPSTPVITVTAPPPPTAQELAGNAVPKFVMSHTTPSVVIHHLTRWRNAVCPRTLGLDAAMNAFVTARILAVAGAVGAPHEESPSCKSNVLILFTLEPQQVLDAVMKQDSRLVGFHYAQQEKQQAKVDRPIQGWYVTSTRNWKGVERLDDPLPLNSNPDPTLFGSATVPGGQPGSRLTELRSSQVVRATVVVDANKIRGMTIGALSDFLAVLTLSQARAVQRCSQLPSIMDLMAPECEKKPQQITAGDLAFLRALYAANLETPVALEMSNIEAAMMREFTH